MALAWTNFNNGDTLLVIKDAINAFETAVVVDADAKDIEIAALEARILALEVLVASL